MSKNKIKVHRCRCVNCIKHPRSKIAIEHRAINNLLAGLDEKSCRQCAGALALQLGWGGVTALHVITGLNRRTIQRGLDEIEQPLEDEMSVSVRHAGGGRRTTEKNIQRS